MQGAAGMIAQPQGYLARAAALCREHDVLLIADEVATGFGRTGTLFACEQEGVSPDLLCVAKGLTGGYLPLAATLASDPIYQQFLGNYSEQKSFFHGHSYTGNPLACAAALASLDVFAQDHVLDRLPAKIELLSGELEERVAPLAHVGQVRQRGLMVGIELMREPARRESYAPAERIGQRGILAARRRGVILRPLGDVLVLMPPLAITADEIATLVGVAAEAIAEVTGT